ncbi:MAG: aminotransferase DegT [Bdellovibrio sp.]|nr:MAG: aminotransferase DegT [Bdellovibrio sp.]
MPFIDLKAQYRALKSRIDSRIQSVLEHGAFVNGPEVVEAEKKLAELTGAPFAIACASGTDALTMPMMALGLKTGDEVITTAFSFIATAETIILAGGTPVYVDIESETFNIDVKKIESAITPKTKGIMPVSLYGQIPDMEAINALAAKHKLWVLEDGAQSFGASQKQKRSCNLSLVAGTSFFPAKPLGCYGDGGAIFTRDEALYRAMKEIRDHGSESRYYHTRLGVNGRLDTLQCAILLAKMERYPWEIEQRERLARRYSAAFQPLVSSHKHFSVPKIQPGNHSVWAQYTLTVANRDDFQKKMNERGVPTAVHYPRIMPDQPWYQKNYRGPTMDWTVARWAAQHVVSLPIYPDMDEATQDRVIQAVKESL